MIIIPAIDLLNKKVVRLLRGEYDKEIIYSENPLDIALQWINQGAQRMHIVDLAGALKGEITSSSSIQEIASATKIPLEFGGGVRNEEDIQKMLSLGVSYVVLGTRACTDLSFLKEMLDKYGDKIIVGVDAKEGMVSVKGWTETIALDSISFVKELETLGVSTVIYTDIATDGMLQGHNVEVTQKILDETSRIAIIASGGVGSLDDIKALTDLNHQRLLGVIVGRALYENKFTLEEAIGKC